MIIKLNTVHYCVLSILLLASGISFSAYAGAPPGPTAPLSFGNLVWADINGDGFQDGEPGIPGVTVNICGASDSSTIDCSYSDSTSTGSNGDYLFTNIVLDEYYYVAIDLSTLPSGASATTPTELFFMNNNDGLPISTADFGFQILEVVVPVPAAIWLFGSGLLAFLGVARRKHAVK